MVFFFQKSMNCFPVLMITVSSMNLASSMNLVNACFRYCVGGVFSYARSLHARSLHVQTHDFTLLKQQIFTYYEVYCCCTCLLFVSEVHLPMCKPSIPQTFTKNHNCSALIISIVQFMLCWKEGRPKWVGRGRGAIS